MTMADDRVRISTAGMAQGGKAPVGADSATGAWPLTVELSPDSIPATAPIDVEGFLAGDSDPCQVVAKVPVGPSTNGYFFSEAAVRDIAAKIAKDGATAGLGHIEPDAVGYRYPPVAVAWVGAIYDDARRAAFVRGYVDPSMPDLKRHIRSQVINRVSTDGYARMETDDDGGKVLISFDLVSLDLAPRLRNGTESPIVARDMKWKEEADVKAMDETKERAADAQAEVRQEGIGPEAMEALSMLGKEPLVRVRDLVALEERVRKREQEEALARVVDEMVEGEDARPLVMKLAAAGGPGSEEDLKARVKDVLADPAVRRVLDARFAPAGARIPAAGNGDAKDGLLVKLNY